MRHKLYLATMIVLPLFVGSLAISGMIISLSGSTGVRMSPIVLGLMAISGMGTGIANLWRLIVRAES